MSTCHDSSCPSPYCWDVLKEKTHQSSALVNAPRTGETRTEVLITVTCLEGRSQGCVGEGSIHLSSGQQRRPEALSSELEGTSHWQRLGRSRVQQQKGQGTPIPGAAGMAGVRRHRPSCRCSHLTSRAGLTTLLFVDFSLR